MITPEELSKRWTKKDVIFDIIASSKHQPLTEFTTHSVITNAMFKHNWEEKHPIIQRMIKYLAPPPNELSQENDCVCYVCGLNAYHLLHNDIKMYDLIQVYHTDTYCARCFKQFIQPNKEC
jgi:hypothetical protein